MPLELPLAVVVPQARRVRVVDVLARFDSGDNLWQWFGEVTQVHLDSVPVLFQLDEFHFFVFVQL
eukprot:COSAG06_NODE_2374_length_6987_cov_3.378049_4_plen_65_part_00